MSLIFPSLVIDMITAKFPMVLVQDGVLETVLDGVPDAVPDGVPNGVLDRKTPCDFSP
jgi:hypothetical protein